MRLPTDCDTFLLLMGLFIQLLSLGMIYTQHVNPILDQNTRGLELGRFSSFFAYKRK